MEISKRTYLTGDALQYELTLVKSYCLFKLILLWKKKLNHSICDLQQIISVYLMMTVNDDNISLTQLRISHVCCQAASGNAEGAIRTFRA